MANLPPRISNRLPHSSILFQPISLSSCTRHCLSPTHNRRMFCQQITPQWAPNAKDNDPEVLNQRLKNLLAPNGRWVLTPSGEGVQRLLRFKTFKNAWGFMQTTTDEIKKVRHHPEWSNTYNTVFVRWTTHSPKGLSHLDIHLAEATDRVAEEFQELKEASGNSANDGRLVGLVDDITKNAGDCCVPKEKPAEL